MIAHNEGHNIGRAVRSVFEYVDPDRLVLVADCCTDETVDIARALGAEVYEEDNKKIGTSLCSALDRLDDEIVFFSAGDVQLIRDPSPLLDLMRSDVFLVAGGCQHTCWNCGNSSGRITRRQPWGAPFLVSYMRKKVVLETPGLWTKKSNLEPTVCRPAFEKGWDIGFDGQVYGLHFIDASSLIGAVRFRAVRRPYPGCVRCGK